MTPTKPDLDGRGLSHPARYSPELLPVFRRLLEGCTTVLDPFAGTGRIHDLGAPFVTTGVELEPEWAALRAGTMVGDATALTFDDETFDAVCTSPTYGNRCADHHDARDGSVRRTYRHDLGRPLTPGNTGELFWGPKYRALHERAWAEAVRVLRRGGSFALNTKDFYKTPKKGAPAVRQEITAWHVGTLVSLGLVVVSAEEVATRHLKQGANRDLRCRETVTVLRKAGS